ncbi:aminotransferase class I/II-fold pyridoxal phosphate-dependent enzyme, partial [Rossellomorea aquimaris]
YLYGAFEELGLPYTKSMANFVLVKLGDEGETLYQDLMKKGVIVRHGKGWGLPEYVRVSIGTQEENEFFVQALRELIQK